MSKKFFSFQFSGFKKRKAAQSLRALLPSTLYPLRSKRGFTALIATVLAAIVIAIGLAILEVTSKQVILAGIARESEIAFQAANASLECAFYHDAHSENGDQFDVQTGGASTLTCFGSEATNIRSTPAESGDEQKFEWTWNNTQRDVCSIISVYKFFSTNGPIEVSIDGGDPLRNDCPEGIECTVIKARGYNKACDLLTGADVLERELTAIY